MSPNHQASSIEYPISGVLRFCSVFIGLVVIALAAVVLFTQMSLHELISWVEAYFGSSFTLMYAILLSTACACLYRLATVNSSLSYWQEIVVQCANGISTLALTFTLLGISIGIGTLAEQSLSPENVQSIIGELTAKFSMAFMTTVVGLPTAACLRAAASIIFIKRTSTE